MQPSPWTLPFAALFGAFGRKSAGDEQPDSGSDDAARRQAAEREKMVRLLMERGIRDPGVLAAMGRIARHEFVPPDVRHESYADRALPIGGDQTISQPYIVALMTQALELTPESRVLEVGTGSAYQTAILCELSLHVTTIEVRTDLAQRSSQLLERMGYANLACRVGDGALGAPDRAPFDAIIVTAAPDAIPRSLVDQLAVGGRMCIPVGAVPSEQRLLKIVKLSEGSIASECLAAVRFVPLVGGVGGIGESAT